MVGLLRVCESSADLAVLVGQLVAAFAMNKQLRESAKKSVLVAVGLISKSPRAATFRILDNTS